MSQTCDGRGNRSVDPVLKAWYIKRIHTGEASPQTAELMAHACTCAAGAGVN